jgi:hypothetical protein
LAVDAVLADTFQLRFRVKDYDEIAVVPKPVREKRAQTGTGTDDGEEGDDHGDDPVFQTDSDVESVAESAEASAEDCLDDEAVVEPVEVEEDQIGTTWRAAPGTHTTWCNGYFTLCKNSAYTDAKMIINSRWTSSDELGQKPTKSKTITITKLDTNLHEPTNTYLALRAWMLHRAQTNGWHKRSSARLRWFKAERALFQQDYAAVPPSAAARELIEEWMPDV